MNEENTAISVATTGPVRWRSTRFILSYLASGGLCMVFFQRASLSLAIVCMVNHTALHVQQDALLSRIEVTNNWTSSNRTANISSQSYGLSAHSSNTSRDHSFRLLDDQRCQSSEGDERDTGSNSEEDGPFVWDKQTQGFLLGAIYVSYTIMQIPGSYIIHRYGVRMTSGSSVMLMSVCHMLCHPAALISPWAVFALRIVMGFCTAFTIPAVYGMWTRWAPKSEQSQLMGIAFSGQMMANASVFPISALLCQYGFLGGWPTVFYTFGGLGILWSTVWFLLMTDTPETHPRISPSEQQYIITTRADVTHLKGKLSVPWRSIFQSRCFWAIAVAHFVYDWGFFLLMTNLPIFLYETMHFDIQSNGLYSMLPYIALFLVTSSTGFLADVIIKKKWLTVLLVRKLFTVVALTVAGVLLVVMSHLQCQQVVAVVVLLAIAVGVSGMALTGGFFINPYDIAPRYAVSICTVTNSIATISGFINPYFVAALTVDQTREQWQMVFYVTGGLYVAGTVVFCVLAKGHVQPWALPPSQSEDVECEGLNHHHHHHHQHHVEDLGPLPHKHHVEDFKKPQASS